MQLINIIYLTKRKRREKKKKTSQQGTNICFFFEGDVINIPLLRLVCGVVVRNNYQGKPLADEPYVIAANHVADFGKFRKDINQDI